MAGDIREPLITMIDIRCHIGGCQCDRSVAGNFLKSGGYQVAEEEEGTVCQSCNHVFAEHGVMGATQPKTVG